MQHRVLLIGGEGLLGRALLRHRPESVEVFAPPYPGLALEDSDALEAHFDAHEITHTLVAAAWTAVDDCESDPEKAYFINGTAPGEAARRAERRGQGFTFISTDYVFSGESQTPYHEDDEVGPKSVYGESKWRGESAVREATPDHRIIRTSGLYGQGGKDFLTAIVPRIRRGEVGIVTDQYLAPTWVDALAPVVWGLVTGSETGTFHATCSGETTWFDFARRAAELLDLDANRVRPIRTEDLGRPAPRPAYSVLSGDSLKARTGLELPSWDTALRERLSVPDPALGGSVPE